MGVIKVNPFPELVPSIIKLWLYGIELDKSMVKGPEGIANSISLPEPPFAESTASSNDPAPDDAFVVTVNVAALSVTEHAHQEIKKYFLNSILHIFVIYIKNLIYRFKVIFFNS